MRPLFASHPLCLAAFVIAFAAWAIPEISILFTRRARSASICDHHSLAMLIALVWAGLAAGFWFAFEWRGVTIVWGRTAVFSIGILLMILGILLRWYAIRALGLYFTREVAIFEDQVLVETGPYRWIRHPAYNGTMMTLFGIGLALTNWASAIVISACTLLGYAYRVRVEERALRNRFGQAYAEYMRRTRRFVPFLF